jgi:hypothetical protein
MYRPYLGEPNEIPVIWPLIHFAQHLVSAAADDRPPACLSGLAPLLLLSDYRNHQNEADRERICRGLWTFGGRKDIFSAGARV